MSEPTLTEIVESLKKDHERLVEVDNSLRKLSTDSEVFTKNTEESLLAIEETIESIGTIVQRLFMTTTAQAIMLEAITRYVAGYEVGDYAKEIETNAQTAEGDKARNYAIIDKGTGFDSARFMGILAEVSTVMREVEMQKVKAAQARQKEAQAATIVTPGAKPGLRIVQ